MLEWVFIDINALTSVAALWRTFVAMRHARNRRLQETDKRYYNMAVLYSKDLIGI